MSLFFFDFRQGDTVSRDVHGSEFATTEDAFLETYKAAEEMWGTLLQERRDPRRCAFEVRDANRELLFFFPFLEVLESCKDSRRNSTFHDSFLDAGRIAKRAQRANESFKQQIG